MARETKTVPLKKPFPGGDGPVTEIVIGEPSGADYFALGEPRGWVKSGGGAALVDNDQVIKAYTERMIVKPDPLLAMTQLKLQDARAVRECVLSFFEDEVPSS